MRTESKLLRVSWNPNDMNGEHLSPKTRELLDKPIEERIAHIQPSPRASRSPEADLTLKAIRK
jgi:hypothetical protein